jgi:hypothetical protein
MHRNNEGAIGAQAGRETRRRHANKKWAHSMHWACTQVHTPSSALGIPCNRRTAMLGSWPRAAAASSQQVDRRSDLPARPEHVKLWTSAIFFFLPLHWDDAIPAGGSSHHVKRDQPHSDKTCDLCARQAT